MRRALFQTGARAVVVAGLPTLALVAASCTSQPVILPSRDFDRPTDVTFVCMGSFSPNGEGTDAGADAGEGPDANTAGGTLVASGRPMRECHPRGTVDPTDPHHHTFAFLPNSSSGELSVIDADKWGPVNLDPQNAGFNRLPIGVLPSQIAASDDGCRLVTANHGSCDLSVIDPAVLLAPTLSRDEKTNVSSLGGTVAINVVPKTKSGRELRLFAGEVAFLPMPTPSLTKGQNLCSGDPAHQWQALATFPSCDLVALIDLPSGVIQKAAHVERSANGVSLVPLADGEEPVCPSDCLFPPVVEAGAGEAATDAGTNDDADDLSDAGAVDAVEAGAPMQVPAPPSEPGDVPSIGAGALLPGPIAIVPETGRAYVGLANAAYVLALDVHPNSLVVPAGGGAIPLHEAAQGVNRLRLSIDPYKEKTVGTGIAGTFIGDDPALAKKPPDRQVVLDRKYLYVVARDGSLRVVQVANLPETECETNLDFAAITDPVARTQAMNAACPPVVGPAVRRPSALGPGLRFPTPPIDVAVADVRPPQPDNSETSVSGAHAWVLTAAGSVYLVNIDPVTRDFSFVENTGAVTGTVLACTNPPDDCHHEDAPPPNTVRNRSIVGYTAALDPSSGPPRLDIPPSQSSVGPRIETIWTLGSDANATALTSDFIRTEVFFPDPPAVNPQSWAVSWEGNLMANPRFSGKIQPDASGGSTSLVDLGMDFCRVGAQTNDIVTFEGCTNTNQCNIGKECVFGSNGALGAGGLPITGLCLTPTLPHGTCDDLLSTVKRYDVTFAHQDELGLAPHKDELILPPLKPCRTDEEIAAEGGADGGADGGPGPRDASGADASKDAGSKADGRDARGDANTANVGGGTCRDPEDPSTMLFQCLPQENRRCLIPCTVAGETTGCRAGRICVPFNEPVVVPHEPKRGADGGVQDNRCDHQQCYCADGPDLSPKAAIQQDLTACLGELLPYQVGVGRGFLVSGSQTPAPTTGLADAHGVCVPFPDLDPRVRARIPMDAPVCTNVQDNSFDSRCFPSKDTPDCQGPADGLKRIAQTPNDPNPCLFVGGLNETDPPNQSPQSQHIHALFRNREIEFMLTNLERPPSGAFQIRFDVHGGFQPQTVAIPSTVEVTMPARIVLGPFDSYPQTGTPGAITTEVPYLFVVDQRRLGRTQGGGPTRGQLLRIHPRGLAISSPATGAQPWYEDLNHSANLFPIQ